MESVSKFPQLIAGSWIPRPSTLKKDSPIIIIFEDIQGKHSYTGSQTYYNKHNEKRQYFFTTLTESQFKKLKETGETGWKD